MTKGAKGFTLIELMVVLSITAVLGTLGIASFTTYNQIQALQSSANDLVTTLNLAKSRAQSQIKPPGVVCASPNVLKGYSVALDTSGPGDNTYTMDAICSTASDLIVCSGTTVSVISSKSLSSNIEFVSPTDPETYCFPTLIGGVRTETGELLTVAGNITLSGYGRTMTIIIDPVGGVRIQ